MLPGSLKRAENIDCECRQRLAVFKSGFELLFEVRPICEKSFGTRIVGLHVCCHPCAQFIIKNTPGDANWDVNNVIPFMPERLVNFIEQPHEIV